MAEFKKSTPKSTVKGGQSTKSTPKPSAGKSGATKYEVKLTGGTVTGSLGRTPGQRQRSSGVQRNMPGAASSSDPGGLKASGLSGAVAPYLSRSSSSTPGRTGGREVTSAPSTGGTRPSSVARGTTAGAGKVGAITKATAKAVPSGGRGQSVTKQTAKSKGRGGSARTVRF